MVTSALFDNPESLFSVAPTGIAGVLIGELACHLPALGAVIHGGEAPCLQWTLTPVIDEKIVIRLRAMQERYPTLALLSRRPGRASTLPTNRTPWPRRSVQSGIPRRFA